MGSRTLDVDSAAYRGSTLALYTTSIPTVHEEHMMTEQSKDPQPNPSNNQAHEDAAKREEAKNNMKKAESEEVAGRHQNDGKNDNAGHKTAR